MENRIVIRGHGAECDQYMEMFVDFGREYTISDIGGIAVQCMLERCAVHY